MVPNKILDRSTAQDFTVHKKPFCSAYFLGVKMNLDRLKRHNHNLVTSGSPTPMDLFLELDSLNSTSQTSSSNQEQNSSPSFSIFEKNLPSLKEARKVAIIIGVVIFLGIGYIARFTLTIDETISVGYNLLFRYVTVRKQLT